MLFKLPTFIAMFLFASLYAGDVCADHSSPPRAGGQFNSDGCYFVPVDGQWIRQGCQWTDGNNIYFRDEVGGNVDYILVDAYQGRQWMLLEDYRRRLEDYRSRESLDSILRPDQESLGSALRPEMSNNDLRFPEEIGENRKPSGLYSPEPETPGLSALNTRRRSDRADQVCSSKISDLDLPINSVSCIYLSSRDEALIVRPEEVNSELEYLADSNLTAAGIAVLSYKLLRDTQEITPEEMQGRIGVVSEGLARKHALSVTKLYKSRPVKAGGRLAGGASIAYLLYEYAQSNFQGE